MADNATRIAELQTQYERLVAERTALGDRYLAGDVDLLPQIKELNAEIRATILEQEALTSPTPGPLSPPIVSSIPLPATTPPTDTNTDAQTKPFSQTQSTPAAVEQPNVGLPVISEDGATSNLKRNPETGELYDPGGAPTDATAPAKPGVGADDDNPQQSTAESSTNSNSNSDSSATGNAGTDAGNGTATSNDIRSLKITPQPNVLDQFASYTWQASIYLMSSEQYVKFMTSKGKTLSGYNLLIQNSGAPVGSSGFAGNQQTQSFYENNGVDTSASAVTGRSPAFPLDFYIDNIELKSRLVGGGTGLAHNNHLLKFQITEPNGITLLSRLYQAVQDAAPRNASGPIDYSQAQYLMVLRWYGWDQDGNPQLPSDTTAKTDPRAVVEKYIPFQIKDISFTVSNRLVTYDVTANPIGQLVAGTSRRGTIQADLELTGKTVEDVLQGSKGSVTSFTPYQATQAEVRRVDNAAASVYYENDGTPSTTGSPPPASSASTVGTMTAVGLAQAMNSLQQELVNKKTYQYADTYEIVFAPGAEAIKSAKVTHKDPASNQGATPMGIPTSQNPDSALSSKQSVTYNGRNIGIPAGASMLYVIDKIIRDSSFVYDQATAAADESDSDTYKKNNASNAKPIQWYNIMMEAIPDGNKYDSTRNAPVYKIRYTISTYTVQNFVSRFFPTVPWLGVHKSYPYWFTGQNIAVLDYQATFNAMYQLILSGNVPGNNQQNALLKQQSASMQDQIKWYYAPRADQSTAGAENRGNEIPAEAAEYLYGPSALGMSKLRIIGDPAWIQQGSMNGVVTVLDSFGKPFLPDGTINFDGMQPMFEIAWQKPQDYDISTGLADPYSQKDRDRLPKQSFIYQGVEVTSEFRGGRFEQTLEGKLYPFPVPGGSNAVAKSPGTATQADVRRVDNATLRSAPQPGVTSNNGAVAAPGSEDSTNASNSSGSENNGVEPADTVMAQDAPEAPSSDGADVQWAGYDPPPKLGGVGDNTDPPQLMVLEA